MDNSVGDLNRYNPFWLVSIVVADFLKKLEFVKSTNYSIYVYDKYDVVNFNLPAIFIDFEEMSTTNTGYMQEGTISIEILRNPSVQNRSSEYLYNQQMMERTITSMFNTSEFLAVIQNTLPYICYIGEKYKAKKLPNGKGSKITFPVRYLFLTWKNFVDESNYYPFGQYEPLVNIQEALVNTDLGVLGE